MNQLIAKLKKIEDECVPKTVSGAVVDEKDLDEFTRVKKKIAENTKRARQMIRERDELESTAPGSRAAIEHSHEIRKLIKECKSDADKLTDIQKEEEEKYRKKNKTSEEKEEQIERRQQTVQLVQDHLKEIDSLNKKRYGNSSFLAEDDKVNPEITELPDIDDAGFKRLRQNDMLIDQGLDEISQGVANLKEMAHEMGTAADRQGRMLDDTTAKVDKVNEELENINVRLKKALESIRKGDRFIVDVILLCLLLGLCGYIYSIVKK